MRISNRVRPLAPFVFTVDHIYSNVQADAGAGKPLF